MSAISVSAHELWWKEPSEFLIDRPQGNGCYVLMRFHSPMQFLEKQSLICALPGQCVLFSPHHPQWYRGRDGAWTNDWMHLHGKEVGDAAARYDVPMNQLLSPGDTRFWLPLWKEITREHDEAGAHWQEAVDLLVHQLLLQLGRALRPPEGKFAPAEGEHRPALRALRRRVHNQLTQRWTVNDMAQEVGLSASRFAALYKEFFGVSPVEDLLRVRLAHAANLLTNRAISVNEAAARSGFAGVHYFSHVFHRRVGCAPRDYHKRRDLWTTNATTNTVASTKRTPPKS